MWEEGKVKDIENLYTVTALSFRGDGSRLALVSNFLSVKLYNGVLKWLALELVIAAFGGLVVIGVA